MAFTVANTDWNALTRAEAPSNSTNPVLKLTAGTSVLWAKAAPGGKRIAFAGDVLGRIGFTSAATRVVSGPERSTALSKMKDNLADQAATNKLGKFIEKLAEGCDFVLMQDVPGVEFETHLNSIPDDAGMAKDFMKILGTASIQDDLARLIAADLLLGNFDRIAHNATDRSSKFHAANFIYSASRFLPIDNDTIAPSLQHMRVAKNAPPATKEDLYRLVIQGGILNAQTSGAFPAAEQSSMDALLGANALDATVAALSEMVGEYLSAKQKADLRTYAQTIVPKVRTEMRTLIAECKSPGGGRQGLNALMKAQNNLEGMNYTVFKVKGRFADFLLNGNMTEADATDSAVAYGKYRDWKNQFDEYLVPPAYALPKVKLRILDTKEKFKRNAFTAATTLSKVLPNGQADDDLERIMQTAKTAKKDLRKGNPDEAKLRQLYNSFSGQLDVDNRVIKAKTLIVGNLLRIDLSKINAFLGEILKDAPQDGVARYYGKIITKRGPQMAQLTKGYSDQIRGLKPALEALPSGDKAAIGEPVLTAQLNLLSANLSRLANL